MSHENAEDGKTPALRRAKRPGPKVGASIASAAAAIKPRMKRVPSVGRHAARDYDPVTGRKRSRP